MLSNQKLLEKISNNKLEILQISDQIANGIEKLNQEELKENDVLFMNSFKDDLSFYLKSNKILSIACENGSMKWFLWNISTRKAEQIGNIVLPYQISQLKAAVMSSGEHLVIGDSAGYVSIFNLNTMTVEASKKYLGYPISNISYASYGNLFMFSWDKNIGFGRYDVFTKKFCETDLIKNYRFVQVNPGNFESWGDSFSHPFDLFALDFSEYTLFTIDKRGRLIARTLQYTRETDVSYRDAGYHFLQLGGRRQCNDGAILFCGRRSRTKNELLIYKVCAGFHQIDMLESIKYAKDEYPVKVILPSKDFIYVITNKFFHVYKSDDFENVIPVGKMNFSSGVVALPNNEYFTRYQDHALGQMSVHELNARALDAVLNAVKRNTSLKRLSLHDRILDEKNIQVLDELKKIRPALKCEFSNSIQLQLDKLMIESALEEKNQECTSLCENLSLSIKQQKEMQEALDGQLNELKIISSTKIAELKEIIENEKEHYLNDIAQLESLIDTEREEHMEELRLREMAQVESKPLSQQIIELKTDIDQRLLAKLVKEGENIENFYLIRWSEKKNVQPYKNDLIAKGAILTVDDLCQRIETIKPPHNEEQKIERLRNAVEKLMLDYEEEALSKSAIKSLKKLIVHEIKKDIKQGEPSWLKKLYSTKLFEIKNNIKNDYFLRRPREAIPSLNTQFEQVIKEILNNEGYEIYHGYLRDPEILDKIRIGNNDDAFNQLAGIIKNKINTIEIELNADHHQEAMRAILKNPTPEMNKLIHDKITQYGEKLKDELNPQVAKIRRLEARILELQSRPASPRVTTTPGTLFPPRESRDQQNPVVVSTLNP